LEGADVSCVLVVREMIGVLHLFMEKCSERPFSFSYVLVSVLERIFDRTGFFTGPAKDSVATD
jgi:hypothetical protein